MAKMEPVVNANTISRISAGTVIKGEIISPCDIRIDGVFEGKVQSNGRVVIGDSAQIKGDVICENIDLWGHLDGNVYVKDTLALKESCVVNGNLHIKRLSVDLGAKFTGSCKMITDTDFSKIAGTSEKTQQKAPVQATSAAPAN